MHDSRRANVHLTLTGPDGQIKAERHVHNLIVDTGLAHLADALSASPGENAMSHMAVGTDDTAADPSDTALGSQVDRNALTSRTDSGAVVTYVGDWAAGDATNSALAEAGIFNAASDGTMLARATFTPIDKQAEDTLSVTWTVTFSAA